MTTTTLGGKSSPLFAVDMRELPLWAWAIAASAAFAVICASAGVFPDARTFFDTDDATRMVQVRELLEGSGWFDTTLPRFGGDYMLLSHWSRLVDLPVATLIAVFRLVLDQPAAEMAAKIVWPLSLFAALLWLLARTAELRAGRAAAGIAMVLAMFSLLGTSPFAPGRIDHHNVMVLSAVAGALFLARSVSKPGAGWIAGFALGLGTAIGYEAILFTILTLTAATLLWIVTGRGQAGLRRAALAFATTLSMSFILTIAPERWFDVYCDALSLNMVLMASAAATGLTAVFYMRRRHIALRLAGLAATGMIALSLFTAVEPACLGGPFGQIDPRLWPEWLTFVRETHGIGWYWSSVPMMAVAYLVHVALGLAASIAIWRRDRDPAALHYAIFLWLWCIPSLWQAKLMPYAAMLAVPAIAVAIARLPGVGELSATTVRLTAATFACQYVLFGLGSILVPSTADAKTKADADLAVPRECLKAESLAPLAALPSGLALAPIDLGPYLVADTAMAAYAAPYHRLGHQIIATNDIFRSSADDVELRLHQIHIRYVVVCRPGEDFAKKMPDGLMADLLAGRTPPYLAPVKLDGATPLMVWRVK